MTTAIKLKEAIDSRGIRYSFVAQKAGIPLNALSRSLAGKRRLQADELLSICRVTGINLSDILESA